MHGNQSYVKFEQFEYRVVPSLPPDGRWLTAFAISRANPLQPAREISPDLSTERIGGCGKC